MRAEAESAGLPAPEPVELKLGEADRPRSFEPVRPFACHGADASLLLGRGPGGRDAARGRLVRTRAEESVHAAAFYGRANGTSTLEQEVRGEDDVAIGYALALDGDTALVSARHDGDGGTEAGALYVHARRDGRWTLQEKLQATDAKPHRQLGRGGHRGASGCVAGRRQWHPWVR